MLTAIKEEKEQRLIRLKTILDTNSREVDKMGEQLALTISDNSKSSSDLNLRQ
jgi:hypothetical protein